MCGTFVTGAVPGSSRLGPARRSGVAIVSRAPTLKIALMVRGLLIMSLETNEVSTVPGGSESSSS